ncbi:MAG: hypothetical protein JOS17DRAFT_28085 [Linnemannia elongata]|nr:MAG: hypothetical protein JOS17DRAFT_28085 [Linnemannia elongata]
MDHLCLFCLSALFVSFTCLFVCLFVCLLCIVPFLCPLSSAHSHSLSLFSAFFLIHHSRHFFLLSPVSISFSFHSINSSEEQQTPIHPSIRKQQPTHTRFPRSLSALFTPTHYSHSAHSSPTYILPKRPLTHSSLLHLPFTPSPQPARSQSTSNPHTHTHHTHTTHTLTHQQQQIATPLTLTLITQVFSFYLTTTTFHLPGLAYN